jgi:hypothetical protein
MAVVGPGASQPPLGPYWVGDFRAGDYCQFATIFESSSVNPTGFPGGYMAACPNYTPFARDPNQRVHLTRRPAPPAGSASRFVSRQELRTTDGPWFEGIATDKATIRLTSEQTLDGPFEMNSTRWFRVSFYLPEQFNWPVQSWYTLADLHNNVADPTGHDWPTIQLVVAPESGKRRFVAVSLEGARATRNREVVRLLRLTRADGSRIAPSAQSKKLATFNRWHTLVVGVRFSDEGTVRNSPGWVQIYFDNARVYSKSRPNVWQGEKSVWLQLQNYKAHGAAFVDGATSSVLYFADARIGPTYASVTR